MILQPHWIFVKRLKMIENKQSQYELHYILHASFIYVIIHPFLTYFIREAKEIPTGTALRYPYFNSPSSIILLKSHFIFVYSFSISEDSMSNII